MGFRGLGFMGLEFRIEGAEFRVLSLGGFRVRVGIYISHVETATLPKAFFLATQDLQDWEATVTGHKVGICGR